MGAIILDGKACADSIEKKLIETIQAEKLKPILTIVTDSKDPASQVYIRNKIKAAERCGIKPQVMVVPDDKSTDKLITADGIIVQLPMADKELEEEYLDYLAFVWEKDVDGLTPRNYGYMCAQKGYYLEPCTPKGILTLLDYYKIDISGKNVVIVGRSNLVGRPLAELMLQRNATVTICHSKTKNLAEHTKNADILVAAVGSPKLITADMVKPGAAVVDVGINRVDGKLCGDVDFEAVKEVAGYITPVPGGVGPMTVISLMENVVEATMNALKYRY